MKLLNKLSILFLTLLLMVFTVAGFVFYFGLNWRVYDNIDEVLQSRAEGIFETLKEHPEIEDDSFYMDQEISIVELKAPESQNTFTDTLIYDIAEKEFISYRKISLVKKLGNRTFKISVIQSHLETDDIVELIFYFLLTLFAVVVSLLYMVNRRLFTSVWSPFFYALRQLDSFQIGQQASVRFKSSKIEELAKLNQSLSKLLEKIQADFKNLKEFTENASHEIQTPLAVVQMKIEKVLQIQHLEYWP